MKSLTLCADDYAQHPGISRAIRELVRGRRLSAVSCFTVSRSWLDDGPALAECGGHFDVGLHFSLTHTLKPSLNDWILASLRGKIDACFVRESLLSQWHWFRQALGRNPDFLDGHQHVHALPGIARVVEETLRDLGVDASFRVRRVHRQLGNFPPSGKEAATRWLAARGGGDAGRFRGNATFAGIRSYRGSGNFGRQMRRWLHNAGDGTLITCHPGFSCSEHADAIAMHREQEFAYLTSDTFTSDLASSGVRLVRFQDLPQAATPEHPATVSRSRNAAATG